MKSIGLMQKIDWGDLRGSRKAKAYSELSKAKANYDVTVQTFTAELLKRLAKAETGRALIKLGKKSLQLAQDFRQNAKRRFLTGDLNRMELNLAKLAYSQMLMDYSRSANSTSKCNSNNRRVGELR